MKGERMNAKTIERSGVVCCPAIYQVPQDVNDPDNHPTEPGWYWEVGDKPRGPFTTRRDALRDMIEKVTP